MVVIHLLDILVSCIEEGESVSQEVLDVILSYLLPTSNDEQEIDGSNTPKQSAPSKLLAEKLIFTAQKQLKPYIEKMLCDIITGKGSTTELKDRYHEVIYEIYLVSPSMVTNVLPQLMIELGCEDADVRKKTIYLLAKIFCSSNGEESQTYYQLFNNFLKRFLDVDQDIRILMVKFGIVFLLNSKDTEGINSVNAEIEKRLRDKVDKVRNEAVIAICEAVAKNPSNINIHISLVKEILLRLRDRKNFVRESSISGLIKIYKSSLIEDQKINSQSKGTRNKKMLEVRNELKSWKARMAVFSDIPSKILPCYFLPDLEDKARIESVIFDETINFDKKIKTPEKVQLLLKFTNSLDEIAFNALKKIFEDKKRFVEEFRNWLTCKNNHDKNGMDKYSHIIVSKLPGNSNEKWKKFSSVNHEPFFRCLSTIIDQKSTSKQVISAYDSLRTKYWSEKPKLPSLKDYIKMVVNKITFRFIDEDMISNITEIATNDTENDSVEESEDIESIDDQRTMELIELLSLCTPNYFSSSVDRLVDSLNKDNHKVSELSLKTLYRICPYIQIDSSELKKILKKLCFNGTIIEAKYASKTLFQVYMKDKKFLSKLNTELVEQVEKKNMSSIPAVMTTLSEMCKYDIVKNFNEDIVYEFSFNYLNEKPKKKRSSKGEAEDTRSKIQSSCIKFLCSFLLASEETDNTDRIKSFLEKLFELMLNYEVENVRSISALCILKIAENKKFEHIISLNQFIELGNFILNENSNDDNIKKVLHFKLFKSLRSLSLPLKYIALLVLYHEKKDYDVKKELQICIQARRRLLKEKKLNLLSSKSDDNEENISRLTLSILPEYSLPYLIYVLAHSNFFSEDGPKYLTTIKYLNVFITELLHGSDNYIFLKQLLQDIKQTEDAQKPDFRGIHIVTEICLRLVNQKHSHASVNITKAVHPGVIFLPAELFRVPGEEEKKLLPADITYLPSDFKLPDGQLSSKILNEESVESPKKRKRKSHDNVTPRKQKKGKY